MKIILCLAMLLASQVWAQATQDNSAEIAKLAWQAGPSVGEISGKASLKVPPDHLFLDAKNTGRFLELNGNPTSDRHYLVAPKSLKWFAVFSFNDSGYIKDDEKIDPEALLSQMQKSDGPGNEERKRLGLAPLYTDGWQVPPHYDDASKRLEWGMRLRTDSGEKIVNYTSRLLARTGVMSAVLVSAPESLTEDTTQFKSVLKNFSYNSGENYAEFKQGDRMAEYGLAALVLGGAAAVATKKGFWGAIVAFFAAFWKLIAAGAFAAFAALRAVFKRK
jgi:uncharacterized membrane-anchored protein